MEHHEILSPYIPGTEGSKQQGCRCGRHPHRSLAMDDGREPPLLARHIERGPHGRYDPTRLAKSVSRGDLDLLNQSTWSSRSATDQSKNESVPSSETPGACSATTLAILNIYSNIPYSSFIIFSIMPMYYVPLIHTPILIP